MARRWWRWTGRLVLGAEDDALREELHKLVAEGKKRVVLNMNNIEYIDSAGLGTLVAAHLNAKSKGVSLKLCHLGSQAPGSPANHQAVDSILRVQYGSSRRRQLLCLKTTQKRGGFVR